MNPTGRMGQRLVIGAMIPALLGLGYVLGLAQDGGSGTAGAASGQIAAEEIAGDLNHLRVRADAGDAYARVALNEWCRADLPRSAALNEAVGLWAAIQSASPPSIACAATPGSITASPARPGKSILQPVASETQAALTCTLAWLPPTTMPSEAVSYQLVVAMENSGSKWMHFTPRLSVRITDDQGTTLTTTCEPALRDLGYTGCAVMVVGTVCDGPGRFPWRVELRDDDNSGAPEQLFTAMVTAPVQAGIPSP